jgi:hypothetical protein
MIDLARLPLLKAADRRYGLIACMADCLRDQAAWLLSYVKSIRCH